MGEDFLRRKNMNTLRLHGRGFKDLCLPDLFHSLPVTQQCRVVGSRLGGAALDVGDTLWVPPLTAAGTIRLYKGDDPVVQLDGEPAEVLRESSIACDGELLAMVVAIQVDDGLIELTTVPAEDLECLRH